MSGVEYPITLGLLASLFGGTGQSAVWFTVGAGLLMGVTLQIAAAVVALYLVVSTIGAPHPVRRHRTGGTTDGTRGSLHGQHVTRLTPA